MTLRGKHKYQKTKRTGHKPQCCIQTMKQRSSSALRSQNLTSRMGGVRTPSWPPKSLKRCIVRVRLAEGGLPSDMFAGCTKRILSAVFAFPPKDGSGRKLPQCQTWRECVKVGVASVLHVGPLPWTLEMRCAFIRGGRARAQHRRPLTMTSPVRPGWLCWNYFPCARVVSSRLNCCVVDSVETLQVEFMGARQHGQGMSAVAQTPN